MTRPDFIRGWLLLTTQPWGKAYRAMAIVTGEPSPAEIQAEFYYSKVRGSAAHAWLRACEHYATGAQWPSLDDLLRTMATIKSEALQLAAPSPPGVSMEEALQERPDLLATVKRVLS